MRSPRPVLRPRVSVPLIGRYGAQSTPDPDGSGSGSGAVRPGRLADQLTWLVGRGMRGVSVGELLAAVASGAGYGLVGLTFDDPDPDFATQVVPRLDAVGFTATVFVVAAELGVPGQPDTGSPQLPRSPRSARSLRDGRQILDLHRRGFEIGISGGYHRGPSPLTLAGASAELVANRQVLEQVLGERVQGLAYPTAEVDDTVEQAAAAAGYRYACLPGRSRRPNMFALPRVRIGPQDGAIRFRAKVHQHGLTSQRLELVP